jgi:hypothetical protein
MSAEPAEDWFTSLPAEKIYTEICTGIRETDNASFRLLSLVPLVSGTALIGLVLQKQSLPPEVVVLLSMFAAGITFGLFSSVRSTPAARKKSHAKLIAMEVFDRTADYDPSVDAIVRVEARRFRAKLKAYYEEEPGTVLSKETAMLNWLLRLWRAIESWVHPRPAPKTYHSSNLHGRRRYGVLPCANGRHASAQGVQSGAILFNVRYSLGYRLKDWRESLRGHLRKS